jgi:hypothetical protein
MSADFKRCNGDRNDKTDQLSASSNYQYFASVYADWSVRTVISGGQLRRKGRPTVPMPRLT